MKVSVFGVVQCCINNAYNEFNVEMKDPIKELPNNIVIELLPKTFGDKAYVLDCEQNPYVRIEAPPSRPLKPYFRFFKRKWISADDKQVRSSCLEI